jgi:hypothetical protein
MNVDRFTCFKIVIASVAGLEWVMPLKSGFE